MGWHYETGTLVVLEHVTYTLDERGPCRVKTFGCLDGDRSGGIS